MVVYQTVEDRDNPDQIEENAPFLCKRKDAWLGIGYYLWDTFEENAHWWGQTNYRENGYVIVKFECNGDSDKLFDLHGKMDHVEEFRKYVCIFREQGLLKKRATVSMIIEFLKRHTDFDRRYDAIRIYGHYSKSERVTVKVLFSKRTTHYFELTPAVQLCLFRKTSLNLQNRKIIYPTKYISDMVI